jgi:hypothetical protein
VELAIAISVPLERVIQLVALLIFVRLCNTEKQGHLHKELKALMSATTFCTSIGVVLVFPLAIYFITSNKDVFFRCFQPDYCVRIAGMIFL